MHGTRLRHLRRRYRATVATSGVLTQLQGRLFGLFYLLDWRRERRLGSAVTARPRVAPMALPVLWHFTVSHFNEKARWALDFKRVPHVRRALLPGFHFPKIL